MFRHLGPTAMILLGVTAPLGVPLAAPPPGPSIYSVTSTSDSGPNTLRRAIRDANGHANSALGPDRITFDLGGTGPWTIRLASSLPEVTDPVVIDGYSQDGSVPATATTSAVLMVVIDAAGAPQGLVLAADASRVSGLVIGNVGAGAGVCDGAGVCVTGYADTVSGNHIGVDATGTVAMRNAVGVRVTGSAAYVGGYSPADRNVISGNTVSGVEVFGATTTVENNRIGTNAAGTKALGNADGIHITGQYNTVGGFDETDGNVVSGNTNDGIVVSGTATVPEPAGNNISGNLVGVAPSLAQLGNGGYGVRLAAGATTLGDLGTPNTIGANGSGSGPGGGVLVTGGTSVIQANLIGVAARGTTMVWEPNIGDGVEVSAAGTRVGGREAWMGNTISFNAGNGLDLTATATGTVVQGNAVGTDATGTQMLGNGEAGIRILGDANTIGSDDPAVPRNRIADNGGGGIVLPDTAAGFGLDNPLLGNEIWNNGGLGIDLEDAGGIGVANANDVALLDADAGPDDLQNYPFLFDVRQNGAATEVQWQLFSVPAAAYRVEFFTSATCEPSGHGEGTTFLLAVQPVTTDPLTGAGPPGGPVWTPLGTLLAPGTAITATATEWNMTTRRYGSTSEFSRCITVR